MFPPVFRLQRAGFMRPIFYHAGGQVRAGFGADQSRPVEVRRRTGKGLGRSLEQPEQARLVPRHQRLRYQGFKQFGKAIDRTVNVLHAQVMQNERRCLMGDYIRL